MGLIKQLLQCAETLKISMFYWKQQTNMTQDGLSPRHVWSVCSSVNFACPSVCLSICLSRDPVALMLGAPQEQGYWGQIPDKLDEQQVVSLSQLAILTFHQRLSSMHAGTIS